MIFYKMMDFIALIISIASNDVSLFYIHIVYIIYYYMFLYKCYGYMYDSIIL